MVNRIMIEDYSKISKEIGKIYRMVLNNENNIELESIKNLINETKMTWDKYLGVVCSQRNKEHSISFDVEETPILTFNKDDFHLIKKYFPFLSDELKTI